MKPISLTLLGLLIFTLGKSQTIDTLLDVGGHKLHFHIVKGQAPPILFEAGNGDDASVWQPLLNDIHKATNATLITYDRAGLGSSEMDTVKISFVQETKDLESALKKLGYANKLFIVCHSFGGYYASLFTYRNPKKVTGVVCIDMATPCFFTPAWSEAFLASIKPADWAMIKTYKVGLYYVLAHFTATARYMSDKFLTSQTPVTLIRAEDVQPLLKEAEKQKWLSCSESFGTMPNHRYIVAKDADHRVWDKSPQLVIKEVVNLYQQVVSN
ncbi:MAG: alpha/beta hydrolase [Cytophagaceae bacterium]|nr:MAG: alpha/beta hydrolase [Cytophagaceae bacterium]